MSLIRARVRSIPSGVVATTGLNFPSNGTSNSDIRLVWSGANYLPRYPHTAIWRINYTQQTGFYAVTWHADIGGGFGSTNDYQYGAHPYPCDGSYNASGIANGTTGAEVSTHYMECAGLPNQDQIALPMEPAFSITKGVWLVQARVAYVSGTDVVHRVYPDVENNPTLYIESVIAKSDIDTDETAATTPAFYFGASHWRSDLPSAGQNDETISGILRGVRLFDANLSQSEIEQEAAAIGNNTAASTTGLANTFYINDNPTPTDITDKSGAGNTPSWDNANRPSLWEG